MSLFLIAAAVLWPPEVTFTEHIAPIVFQKCTQCHRPGQVGPFSFMSFRDVRKRGRVVARLTRERAMPPWLVVEGHGDFVGSLRLSDDEIQQIQAWVDDGMPEGDPAKLPDLPEFAEGWHLGEPDLVLQMPEPFEVPADGPDIYRNFRLPLPIEADRWVTAIEVQPGSRASLHHVLFHVDASGTARRLDGQDGQPGWFSMAFGRMRVGPHEGGEMWGLGGWAVGAQPMHLPEGLALRLPGNSDFVVQNHLQPIGKPAQEQTTIGLYFADAPPTRTLLDVQLPPAFGRAAGIDIPPGAKDFQISDSLVLPVDTQAVSVFPHAHMICTEMQLFAECPGEERRSIFLINDWDFDWQNNYMYREPLDLPAGTRLDVLITYDNSADNPDNPFDPPQRIRWGLQSTDEMGSVQILLVAKEEPDLVALQQAIQDHEVEHFRTHQDAAAGGIPPQLLLLDRNNDGKIEPLEIPRPQRRRVLSLDTNKDGVIDRAEMEAAGRRGSKSKKRGGS